MKIEDIDLEAQLRLLDRADCEESLMTFMRHAWPHMDPAPLSSNWHLDDFAMHLEAVCDGAITRLICNVPPRSSKTSLATICFPAWVWCQSNIGPNSGPQVSFMYCSYNESLSMDHNVACRRLIKSEWYQSLWGDRFKLLDDSDTKSSFLNDKGGRRFITSIGSRVTGKGADIIVMDDPDATNDAESETILKTTNDYYDNTLKSRLNNKKTGAIICVQQRVAEGDMSGHLLDHYPGEFDHFMVPLEFEPDRSFPTSIGWKDPRTYEGEPLWPDRFDEKFVAGEKKNPWVYASQYMQRPAPKGGGIIATEWWQLWEPPSNNMYPPFDYILASLDTAYGQREESDHSAMTIWGVFSEDITTQQAPYSQNGRSVYDYIGPSTFAPKVMLMYAWSASLQFHDLIERVVKECRKFKVDKLIVENKASGISVAQEIRRLYQRENFMTQLVNPGNQDKVARLHSVVPIFSNGLVYAPDKEWAQMTITKVSQFPKSRRKDIVDTTSQALRHLRDGGMLELRQERELDMSTAMQFNGNAAGNKLYPA